MMPCCTNQGSPEKQNQEPQREERRWGVAGSNVEELAHKMVGADMSEMCRAGWQAGASGKSQSVLLLLPS